MATTRIQSGGVTALSITHDKLHTDMNLSTKTVVLPTLSDLKVTNTVGLGVTPGVWSVNYPALQIGQGATFTGHKSNTQTQLGQNWWVGTGNQYVVDGAASRLVMSPDSTIEFTQAPSGTAGATMSTVNTRLIIKPAGNVGIGTNSPDAKFTVSNAGAEGFEFFPSAAAGVNTTQHYNRSGSAYVKNRTIALNHEWVNGATDPAMNLIPDGDSTFLVIKAKASTFSNTANISFYGTNANLYGGSLVSRATVQAQTDGTAFGTKLRLLTNNTSNVETRAITIDASQQVGIGTDSPARPLNIVNDAGSNPIQSIRNSNTAWSQYALTRYGTEGEDVRYMDFGYYRGATEATRGLVIKSQADDTLVTFLDSGNVGIGVSSPFADLTVGTSTTFDNGDNYVAAVFQPAISGGESAGMLFGHYPASGYAKQGIFWERYVGASGSGGQGKLHFVNRAATDTSVPTLADTRMTIDHLGKVGIGTDDPDEILTLNSSSNTRLLLQESGNDKGHIGAGGGGLYIKNLAGDVIFRNSSDADTVRIKNDGNVGIGTTDPASKLHVYGRLSGGELGNTDIVRKDLHFYVDFNDKACVSGQSSTEAPIDLSPAPYNLTLHGGANFEHKDGIGTYYFDGSNDHININDFQVADTSNTYEVWHWSNSQSGWETFWDSGTERPLLGLNGNQLKAYPSGTSFGTIDTGKWYHIVFAFASNNDLDVYVNGARVAEAHNWNHVQKTGTFQFWLGGDTTHEGTNGYIGVARAYTRQLTLNEVQQNYNAEVSRFAVATPSLGVVHSGGNVGIGTNNPSMPWSNHKGLHIKTAEGASDVRLEKTVSGTTTSDWIIRADDAGDFIFRNNMTAKQPVMIDGVTGNVGINNSSPEAALTVNGVSALYDANGQYGLTITETGVGKMGAGEINMIQGWSGTLTNGDTLVFTYNKVSWAAYGFEIEGSNAGRWGKIEGGGYSNGGPGLQSHTNVGTLFSSFAITSTPGNNQGLVMTMTLSGGVHTVFRIRYFQSGGDGVPISSRATLHLNS